MRQFLINFCFVMFAVFSAVGLFVLKYHVKADENHLKQLHRGILNNQRAIHMLQAEWAHLNDPARLEQLVASQTNWQKIDISQLKKLDDIPLRPDDIDDDIDKEAE